jgi:hypothetical protein
MAFYPAGATPALFESIPSLFRKLGMEEYNYTPVLHPELFDFVLNLPVSKSPGSDQNKLEGTLKRIPKGDPKDRRPGYLFS